MSNLPPGVNENDIPGNEVQYAPNVSREETMPGPRVKRKPMEIEYWFQANNGPGEIKILTMEAYAVPRGGEVLNFVVRISEDETFEESGRVTDVHRYITEERTRVKVFVNNTHTKTKARN